MYISLHWRLSALPPKGWRVFVHFEGQGTRFSADHDLISCTPSDFKPGEIHLDHLGVEVKTSRPGPYRVYVGWYRVGERAQTTGAKRDDMDRVEIGTLKVKP